MPEWIFPTVVGSFLTLIITLLVVVVRNRRSLLTYFVKHDSIGISTLDNIHGEVSVTVGGAQMQNLFMSNVWLVNRSSRDIEDLEVKIWCKTDGMRLLSEQTYVEGTVEILKHTAEYEEIKSQLIDSIPQEEHARRAGDHATAAQIAESQAGNWQIWFTQRWYQIPVFARGQTLRLTYMTNVISNADPIIHVSCQKAGVRVKYKQPYQLIWHIWGVSLVEAGFTGIAIGILVWLVVIYSITELWLAALVCLAVGILCNMPGAAIVKCYKWIRTQLIG